MHTNNKGADQPALPDQLLDYDFRSLESIIACYTQSFNTLVEQVGLSVTWSHTPKTGFPAQGSYIQAAQMTVKTCAIVMWASV